MKKLGFGFMRLPMKNENIDFQELNKMVDTYMERGFNYFDTAYIYTNGMSEAALKESVIKRYPRDKVLIATKLPMFMLTSEEQQKHIFDEQLQKCGVEYFDYYLLHALGEGSYKTAKSLNSFEFVQQKKNEGKIKKIGFSYHDNAELLDEILTEHPEMEFVQLQINYLDWESNSVQSRKCYEIARKHKKPVLVMEPVKGGILADVPEAAATIMKEVNPNATIPSWAIRFAASQEGIEMVLSGMSNMGHLLDNTSYMQDFKPFSKEEYDTVNKVVDIINSSITVPCTGCEYCVKDCPMNIPIPNYFTLYNKEKQFPAGMFSINRMYYANYIQKFGKASDCIQCGNCEKHCPQHIEIIECLKDVAKTLEDSIVFSE